MEKRYSIEEVFEMLGEENLKGATIQGRHKHQIEVDGYNVYTRSLRYMTFYQKGTTCVCCGRKGSYFKLDGDEKSKRRHFNLYCDDGTVMTKDHIMPKSLGGLDSIENLQPMCKDCNEKKGNGKNESLIHIIGVDREGKIKQYNNIASVIVSHIPDWRKRKPEQLVMDILSRGSALKASIENGSEYHGRKWYIVSDSD